MDAIEDPRRQRRGEVQSGRIVEGWGELTGNEREKLRSGGSDRPSGSGGSLHGEQ